MSLEVKAQMVRSGEGPLTELAGVWPDSCVFPHVTSQLIRPGELPPTPGPGAHVGLLPRVGPQVGLHVGGLVVGLAAVVVRTVVDLRHLPRPPHLPHLHREFESWWRDEVVVERVGGDSTAGD